MEKRNRNVMILSIVALVLVLVGVTYAYFSAQITGIESASTISMTAGRMSIVYTEGDENVAVNNIYPREEEWVTKTFTLTGYNTTNEEMYYNVGLNVETNGFANGYLTYDLKVLESGSGTPVSEKTGRPINGTGFIKFGKGLFKGANGDKHKYELKIYFKDNGKNQNDGQGAIFNAKISVVEYKPKRINIALNSTNSEEVQVITSYDINKEKCLSFVTSDLGMTSDEAEIYCTGETITDDNYTQSIASDLNTNLKDELISNEVIENVEFTTEVRPLAGTTYNDGQYTYIYGRETSINRGQLSYDDLDNSDSWSVILTDVLENGGNSTEPVTTELCTSINGKPITSMTNMFYSSQATSIDLSTFDTSNVTNMRGMFSDSQATSIDLSSFDTSNVKNMVFMFSSSRATALDLSNFDTSNVTSMYGMFEYSQVSTLDLSSFDTSNVKNMVFMFGDALNLTTIYTSNKFVTTSLLGDNNYYPYAGSYKMFNGATNLVGGAGTTYDANHVDKTYARIDGGPSNPGYFTSK